MDKLDMLQAIFGKVDEFGWWDMERIKNDSGTQFISKYFKEDIHVRGLQLESAAIYQQIINGQVELTCITLRAIVYSVMVHARVSDEYIHLALMYTTDNIFPVLPI